MRDVLAERLLARVLEWTAEDVARERPIVQAMASFKYDDYEQFSPGMRFVESLALWLHQFSDVVDRRKAYEFVKSELIYISRPEFDHLIETALPHYIRPILLERTAEELGIEPWRVVRISRNPLFQVRQQQCLYLGLSDGAHLDSLRRLNGLSNEQVLLSYEISKDRVRSLREKLVKRVGADLEKLRPGEEPRFRMVVLVDDFSASGKSYLRTKDGKLDGKIATFRDSITSGDAASLVDLAALDLVVLLYVATDTALASITQGVKEVFEPAGTRTRVVAMHRLDDSLRISRDRPCAILPLIERYYDHSVHDEHMAVGGTEDSRLGFAACGLPLVLSHNSPNNSIALLWFPSDCRVRGLFPRVRRHRSMRQDAQEDPSTEDDREGR